MKQLFRLISNSVNFGHLLAYPSYEKTILTHAGHNKNNWIVPTSKDTAANYSLYGQLFTLPRQSERREVKNCKFYNRLSALDKYSELTFSNLEDSHSEVYPIRGFPFSFVSSYFPWLSPIRGFPFSFVSSYFPWLSCIVTPLKDFFLSE